MLSDIRHKDKDSSGIYIISAVAPFMKWYVGSAKSLYNRFINHKIWVAI